MKLSFQKERLAIIGGSCEIGQILARQALQCGLKLLLASSSRESQEPLQRLFESEISQGAVETAVIRLEDPESHKVLDRFSPHYLVDLAQPDYEALTASADEEQVHRFFSASLSGRSALLKRSLRCMISQKFGRVVFVSSTAADRINPGQAFYSASKSAAEKLYEAAGIEMGRKGITSAVLRPGYIASGRGNRFRTGQEVEQLIPTGRVLNPQETAQTILFLLSDSALQINASVITMDGGMSRAKML